MYVSKFEKKLPTEEIGVVVAAARGQATRKEGIDAGLYAIGCAAQFIPADQIQPTPGPGPNPMVSAISTASMSDEDCATALEGHLASMSAVGSEPDNAMGLAVPWALIIPLVEMLLSRWLPKPAGA